MGAAGAPYTEPVSSEVDSDSGSGATSSRLPVVPLLAAASALAVGLANASGISIGDDGVGYRAIADSLLAGKGLGYFLERPVTVWPPVWPALMAFVARITPLDTVGAAILLNCLVAALIVLVGNRLLRLVVHDSSLVLIGTAVFALGPASVGLGHVLMTDMAFALVVLAWMILMIRARQTDSLAGIVGAAVFSWVGFGLRYVGLTLIAVGGLWLLVQAGRPLAERIRNGIVYGIAASIVPLAWMARNHAIDGTFTGERHTSARGLVDNGFDIAATIGRFLLPGVLNEQTKPWAAVGVLVTLAAVVVVWRLLATRLPAAGSSGALAVLAEGWRRLGSPVGLVGLWAVFYLAYMLYVRTTTALNQLDLRLLFPAYFPTLILGLVIAAGLPALGIELRRARSAVAVWAAFNIVAGLVAMVGFGMGHPFFVGDYQSDTFQRVRANTALDALPPGCEVYSNLPNALYPRLEPKAWSPQRTALESIDPVDDLARMQRRSADHRICLVWIDEKPVYGHLWTLAQLERRLTLDELSSDGPVSVYRVHPGRNG